MENNIEIANFNSGLETLIKNITNEVRYIELKELGILMDEISPLGEILSKISIPEIEISFMREISDSRVEKKKIVSFLTLEMRFLNTKVPHSSESKKLKPRKWWRSVSVVLESIAHYFQIPYWDIIQEVARLSSIIVSK